MAKFQVLDSGQYRERIVGSNKHHWRFHFVLRGPKGEHPCHLRFLWPDGGIIDGPDNMLTLDPIENAECDLFADLEGSVQPGTYTAQMIIAGEEVDSFTFTID